MPEDKFFDALCIIPDLDKAIKDLAAKNVRVLAYINPNLNIDGSIFKEGVPKGYFVKNSTGQPYLTDFGEFYAATVDLTNPAAYKWYKRKFCILTLKALSQIVSRHYYL